MPSASNEKATEINLSSIDRAAVIDWQFKNRVSADDFPAPHVTDAYSDIGMSKAMILAIFDAYLACRQFDLQSRILKDKGQTYYTIGSAGHEGNAVFGYYFRKQDISFLHYRSAAFQLAKGMRYQHEQTYLDMALSFVASKIDPVSGGRHKVLGSKALFIPPQTSTIASHLPKAVGCAYSIRLAKETGIAHPFLDDSVVLCSFGDASFNHSTAQGALNAARFISRANYPLPLIFICEDNGIGISVPTPSDWIAANASQMPFIEYIQVDGRDMLALYQAAKQAEHIARDKQKPVFLHVKTVRLMGHAGSDIESVYLPQSLINQREADDPLLHAAGMLVRTGLMTPDAILTRYAEIADAIRCAFEKALETEKHTTAVSVMQSIIPPVSKQKQPPKPKQAVRERCFGSTFKQLSQPRNMSQCLNFALTDILLQYQQAIIFGEDVAKKGGVYRVTADLQKRFGGRRVFDSILDEQTILGQAIGLAHNGFLPIPEIQFLAYYHNAQDQIRGEAATLSFFSDGQYTNPMVVRIAGLAYQKGFGGHFHNDNSLAALRDLPGVILACPSRGDEAVKMLRTGIEKAYLEQRVVLFIEPIALYMTKDLLTPGDEAWLSIYPDPSEKIAVGEIGVEGATDARIAILTYGNGRYLAKQAALTIDKNLKNIKIIDIRWLAPLPGDAILAALAGVEELLLVDEGRRSGGVCEALSALLLEKMVNLPKIHFITGQDCFIPLGNAWKYVLPSKTDILDKLANIMPKSRKNA